MRLYERKLAGESSAQISINERYPYGVKPKRIPTSTPIRVMLFEDWRELSTSPIFQLHRLTDAATEILKEGPYALDKRAVKALLVERIYAEGGAERFEPVGVSIKFPSTPEMRRRRGLLVYAYAEQPDPPRVLEDALGFQPVPQGGGLYMTDTRRVLSLTQHHVRICRTTCIQESCSWGPHDRLTGGDDRPPEAEELDALSSLAP